MSSKVKDHIIRRIFFVRLIVIDLSFPQLLFLVFSLIFLYELWNFGRNPKPTHGYIGSKPSSFSLMLSFFGFKEEPVSKSCTTSSELRPIQLLVIRPSPKEDYCPFFDGILVQGRQIQVTQLMWSEFLVSVETSSGKSCCFVHKCNSGGRGSLIPDFLLIRSEVRGVSKDQDYRNSLFGFMFAGVPSVNSLHSIYCFLERPVVQAELIRLHHQLGPSVFPIVQQSYFSSHREMMYGDSFPAVAKVGHAHAGYGKMKVQDHKVFEDLRSLLAMDGSYSTVEPFISGECDLRIQKIGSHYRAFRRESMSGSWKTNTGTSHIEELPMTERYIRWADEASRLFGGLDICTVDVIVEKGERREEADNTVGSESWEAQPPTGGREFIMEVNGTSSGFSPLTNEQDLIQLRDLVIEKMRGIFG